jgi:EAL domain-containing protein (putative c-di-GMP-specific phosphodiesterase class I)
MTEDPVQHALQAVRRHLGMEVAYISKFVDERSVFEKVDAPGLEAMIKPGDSRALDEVYCRHILAGRIPQLMANTADHPFAAAMPITAAVPIGAHMSVPITLPGGRIYGMFCCLSPTPNASLNQRDLDVMRAFADMTALQISSRNQASEVDDAARQRIAHVLAEKPFSIAYQPIYRFRPRELVGYEALCRFTAEPYRTPDLYFNEATRLGHGSPLELCVMERALEAFNCLPDPLRLWINLCPNTVLDPTLAEIFARWPMHRLVLEVTEHAPVADYDALNAALAPLRAAGVNLAIDDAGAGFASLQHIIHLRPDIIKLDMCLTRGIDSDPARRALASALTYFAGEIGAAVLAEGIETSAECEAVKLLGVQYGQGYRLGRPAPLPYKQPAAPSRQQADRLSWADA